LDSFFIFYGVSILMGKVFSYLDVLMCGQELDEQLVSYISSQYGASFAELNLLTDMEKPSTQTPDILGMTSS
jgi:hypothetical protein